MRLFISGFVLFSSCFLYVFSLAAEENLASADQALQSQEHPENKVININLNANNDGWSDEGSAEQANKTQENFEAEQVYDEPVYSENTSYNELSDDSEDSLAKTPAFEEKEVVAELPGKEINYRINLHSSTHFLVDGRASSDIGKILFKSKLMPSNEVKLSLKLKQGELEDVELVAYFDLANFTMELDGGKSILNKDHKKMLKLTGLHLQSKFEIQYQDYDIPEHVLMLVQMLGYWSVSPEGFVHEKRSIISE